MTNQKTHKFSSKAKAVVLGAAILASGAAGTFALLTDTSTTDINITSADFALDVNNSKSGTYLVDIDGSNMKPGDVRSGVITLTNDSSIASVVSVQKSALEGFTADVKDGESAFTTVTLEEGASLDLNLEVALPSSVTESPRDQTLTVGFNATQADDAVAAE